MLGFASIANDLQVIGLKVRSQNVLPQINGKFPIGNYNTTLQVIRE